MFKIRLGEISLVAHDSRILDFDLTRTAVPPPVPGTYHVRDTFDAKGRTSVPPPVPGTYHVRDTFDAKGRTSVPMEDIHSTIVVAIPVWFDRTFGVPGDSGSIVFDLKGNAVGLYHAAGVHYSYVTPLSSVLKHFGVEFAKPEE
ncbi:hypothetical protein GEMRC1_006197 [Eukaryota sp. GEM-RC1]